MEQKHVYAYLLLGAVVLAGAGGFMMADYSPESIAEPTGFHGVMTISISDPNEPMEGIETDGKDS